MPAESPAETEYEKRFTAGSKHALRDFLFFRHHNYSGYSTARSKGDIQIYTTALNRPQTGGGFWQNGQYTGKIMVGRGKTHSEKVFSIPACAGIGNKISCSYILTAYSNKYSQC
jgi:hypothetical protein